MPVAIALGLLVLSVSLLWGAEGLIVGGHAHAHGGGDGAMTPDEFREQTLAYVQAYGGPGGAVTPPAPIVTGGGEDGGEHGDHGMAIDVYLMAFQWAFMPMEIHLEKDTPYRFRMMSMDVHHGVSIALEDGSRVWRLPPGALVEETLTFTEPGTYLIYCSYYCGDAHERMAATIVVS